MLQTKGHVTCADCTEMDTCEELRQRKWAFKRLKEIKAMGTENLVEEMQRKTNAGYCYLDEKSE
jgi:translation initiation factor 2 beta subunit (eIF-2beta)/eIF-5